MQNQKVTTGDIARELAWTVTNVLLDCVDSEMGDITLSQLSKIRDIIEEETSSLLDDIVDNNNEILKWKKSTKNKS